MNHLHQNSFIHLTSLHNYVAKIAHPKAQTYCLDQLGKYSYRDRQSRAILEAVTDVIDYQYHKVWHSLSRGDANVALGV